MDRNAARNIAGLISLLLIWKVSTPFALLLSNSTGMDRGVALVVAFVVLLLGPILTISYIRRRL